MNKIIKWFGVFSGVCVLALSSQVYASSKSSNSVHQYTLQSNMYLCESTNSAGKTTTIYLLNPGQSLEFSGLKLPSINKYVQQKTYWQQWKLAQDGSKDRIISVIDKGTAFSVKQYKTIPTEDYAIVTIALSSGPYAGRDVLFSEHELTLNQLS